MEKRDYSHEAYALMVETIQQIDNTDIQPLWGTLRDLFLRLGQFLGLYSAEQYQDKMQRWYQLVLDSHNTTVERLNDIFQNVETVDFQCRDVLDDALQSIENFRKTINCLRDVISGKTTLAEGQSAAAGYISAGSALLTKRYDELLTNLEQKALWNASKELFGDALTWGASFYAIYAAKDPLEKATAIKKFSDATFATVHDLYALGTILATPIVSLTTKEIASLFGKEIRYEDYLDTRFDSLTQAEGYRNTNSMTDILRGIAEKMTEHLEECPESSPYYNVVKAASDISNGVYHCSEGVDLAVAGYDIVSGLKSTHDTVDEWINGKAYTPEEWNKVFAEKKSWEIVSYTDGPDGITIYAKGSPKEIFSKILSDRTFIPSSTGTPTPATPYSTAKTIWTFAQELLPDINGPTTAPDFTDIFLEKVKDFNTVKGILDFAKDLDSWVQWEKPTVPYTGLAHDPSKLPPDLSDIALQ